MDGAIDDGQNSAAAEVHEIETKTVNWQKKEPYMAAFGYRERQHPNVGSWPRNCLHRAAGFTHSALLHRS